MRVREKSEWSRSLAVEAVKTGRMTRASETGVGGSVGHSSSHWLGPQRQRARWRELGNLSMHCLRLCSNIIIANCRHAEAMMTVHWMAQPRISDRGGYCELCDFCCSIFFPPMLGTL